MFFLSKGCIVNFPFLNKSNCSKKNRVVSAWLNDFQSPSEESVYTINRIERSNPLLSAIFFSIANKNRSWLYK